MMLFFMLYLHTPAVARRSVEVKPRTPSPSRHPVVKARERTEEPAGKFTMLRDAQVLKDAPMVLAFDVATPLYDTEDPGEPRAPSAPSYYVVVVTSRERADVFLEKSDCGVLLLRNDEKIDVLHVVHYLAKQLENIIKMKIQLKSRDVNYFLFPSTIVVTTVETSLTYTEDSHVHDSELFFAAAKIALEDNEDVSAVSCKLVAASDAGGDVIVSYGLESVIDNDSIVTFKQSLEGYSSEDERAKEKKYTSVVAPHCAVFRFADVTVVNPLITSYEEQAESFEATLGATMEYSSFTASLWSLQLSLPKRALVVPLEVRMPHASNQIVNYNVAEFISQAHSGPMLLHIHKARKARLRKVLDPKSSLIGTQLYWDTYCSCTGVNLEAANYVTELEQYMQVRVVAEEDCYCKGHPAEVQRSLARLIKPKTLDKTLQTHLQNEGQALIWVSHKPVEAYPTFPYKGAIELQQRPDYVVGRSMLETDDLPRTWKLFFEKNKKTARIDELWVPSAFHAKVFSDFFAQKSITIPVVVIPEGVNTHLYNPLTTVADPHIPEGFNFLSVFKWEHRKGWDLLLKAFLSLFKRGDGVNLVLKTHLYMEEDANNPDKITQKIAKFAASEGFNVADIPMIYVIAEELPETSIPTIYKACDAFVLPTRGEGWGLGMHQAMSMGLPTIATDWSGQTEFMTSETSLLVKINGVEKVKGHGFSGNWANPDLNDLMAKMKWVVDNREKAAEIGHKARQHIVENFSKEAAAAHVLRRVEEIRTNVKSRKAKKPNGQGEERNAQG